jgi:hypothetical protein
MNGGSITYPDAGTKQLSISGSLASNQPSATAGPLDSLYALLARRAMSRMQNNRGITHPPPSGGPIVQGEHIDPLTKALRQNQMNADLMASNMDMMRMRQKMGPYVYNSNRPPLS